MQPPKRTMMRSGIMLCLLICFSAIKAQKAVHFENIGFDEAVEKAKFQKKIVFVDVQGMNTNPYSEKVSKEVFTLDSVADFFNAHCICIRINMNSEEGKKFAPRLAMLMYPVYVFHGSNGDQLDFTNSASIVKDPAVLMGKARSSLAINAMKIANTRSIKFVKDSWANLLKKAKASNKLIFVDAQTTWCRPCIMMARDIFTLDKVADYYNDKFINVSMDMEKGDGPQLRKTYGVNAYPAFLYIDGNGKLVHEDGGYQESERFLHNGETAVSNKAAGKFHTVDTSKKSPSVIPFAGTSSAIRPASTPATTTGGSTNTNTAAAGIHFAEGSWASLLAMAKQTGKLIFVDANTSWCGPCKQMRTSIFPRVAVSQLYNRNFINVDLDMEKGEGVEFRKKYGVKAYPTFLYIDGDGEVVHKTVGSCDGPAFRQHGLDAMSPLRNLRFMQAQYKNNAQDEAFVTGYLQVLKDAYETGMADSVALAYLQQKAPADLKQPANWALLKEYVNDASSPIFRNLVEEQSAFAKLYGADAVEQKIYMTYMAWPQHYLQYHEKGRADLDQPGFNEFLGQVKKSRYAKKKEIEGRAKLTIYFGLKDWDSYAATADGMLDAKVIPMDAKGAEAFYTFADLVNRFGSDNKQAVAAAAGWGKRFTSPDISGISAGDRAIFMDLYATLLEKAGRNDDALAVRKEINQNQLTNAKSNAPFQMLIRVAPKQN